MIRPATSADVPAILAVEYSAPEAAHWSREQYQAAIEGIAVPRLCLVVEAEGRVQGFLVARAVSGEWELENLAISSGQRRRGWARGLVNELLKSAREENANTIFLEVRASNDAARRLYERCGFIHRGNRTAYYRQPEKDAAVYQFNFR